MIRGYKRKAANFRLLKFRFITITNGGLTQITQAMRIVKLQIMQDFTEVCMVATKLKTNYNLKGKFQK